MQGTAEAAADPGELPEQYVINLCASTTPMALEQPRAEALRRFTFFVSRRREDGRERFRLHMGYFTSPGEAEEWLGVVRELYPAAWVGEAPGKKLRAARAAAARVPEAPAPAATPPVPTATPGAPDVLAVPKAVVPEAAVPAAVSPPAMQSATPPAVAALSNVREVLAQLDAPADASARPARDPAGPPAHTLYVPPPPVLPEHIPTVQALTPPPIVPQARSPAPVENAAPARVAARAASGKGTVAKPAVTKPATANPAAAKPAAAKPAPTRPDATPPPLTDTQVLRVLEERRVDGPGTGGPRTPDERAADTAIEMLRPDDTRTMRALKEEVQRNAAVQFAVQLQWSVSPIDMAAVPPLAIFSAYTLYTVESSREGRKWYGLRLGFFTDALSAKQVAYYVRSDFASVAVVPVTATERDDANAGAHRQLPVARKRAAGKPVEEFKLFDSDMPAAKPVPSAEAVRAKLAEAARAGKRPVGGTRSRAVAPRRKARTLEESLEQTLEILGASELEIDKGRGELLNDSGVRHLSVKVDRRTSTFSKLLERLSDRVGKG